MTGVRMVLLSLLLATAAFAYPAEVENVPPERYFEVALNEIQQAESSVRLYMYLVSLSPNRFGSRVYRLLDALAEAKERGVDVQVVLDRNINWTKGNIPGFWDPEWKNWKAYQYLRERGVNVFFDSKAVFTHAKLLVIDEETVILGSTNWSESAITRNLEASALIRSPEFAREILKGFEALELHAPALRSGPTVSVSWAFLNNPEALGKMVTARDEAAFDAYLYLLKVSYVSKEERIALAYEPLISEFDFKRKDHWMNRRSARKVLQRLQDRYGLIDFSYQWGKEPVVSVKRIGSARGGSASGGDRPPRYVRLPLTYWEWGWNKRLTFAGKVMYLLGEMYSDLSPMEPVWFRSSEGLGKKHGFSRDFVHEGFMNLRRNNLLEVQPDKLNPKDYSNRKANRYVANPLYDPKELTQTFKELEERYGKEKVKRAVRYTSLVYEDSDVGAVKRLILLEEEFGRDVVRRAAEKVGAMSGNNPKKTAGYLINTIRSMGNEEGKEEEIASSAFDRLRTNGIELPHNNE